MTATARTRTQRLTGMRVGMLIVVWLAFAYAMALTIGLYYELLAAWYTLPPLGLVYAYRMSPRSRWTTILAVVATRHRSRTCDPSGRGDATTRPS